jgi:tetratricopeptide (TPR) repeat protein
MVMRSWIVAVVLALLSVRADAQPAEATAPEESAAKEERPWALGVSQERQARALELYSAGNDEFRESRYAQALAKYREAIQHWDHPAIRFNMAVCLINLDQLIEAKENLDRSLAYGEGPLGAHEHADGITYRKLLDVQLAHVWIRCEQHGAQVTLDGKLLFTGPGTAEVFLLPGEHQVVVAKAGFLTSSKTLLVAAGRAAVYDIRHLERRVSLRMARRWDAWKPWAVVSGGVAALNAGVLTYVVSDNNITRYEDAIARCPDDCPPRVLQSLQGGKNRGEQQRVAAIVLLSAGTAAVLAGAVGVIMNQPRLRVEPSRVPSVTPVPGGAVAVMSWGF